MTPGAGKPGLPGLLVELLGATWQMEAPVAGVAWFGAHPGAGGGVAGFALGDGTIALARSGWDGASHLRPREGGGVELVPATAAPPPVMRAGVHAGPGSALAREPAGSLLSGGRDGRLARIAADGTVSEVARDVGPIEALAASPDGTYAFAVGACVHRDGAAEMLPARVTDLRFSPDGAWLAASHAGGIAVWSEGSRWQALDERDGPYRVAAWSADGALLVAGTTSGLRGWRWPSAAPIGLPGGPALPTSLSFAADGASLAAAGGARAVCWPLAPAGGEPVPCGVASTVAVTRVACHPVRPVLAVGYGTGAVLLCRPGSADVLLVRGPAGGAVTALAWSDDGATLALGAEGGEIGLVAFPDLLFRTTEGAGDARA